MNLPTPKATLLLIIGLFTCWVAPANGLLAQVGSTADSVSLTVEGLEACAGDTVCVAVTATAFDSVTSFQFSLTWEEPILELIELQEYFNGLLSFQPTNSDMIVTWLASDLNPNDFDDGDTLLILKMQVLDLGVSGTSVRFGNIAPAEVNLINPAGGAAILVQPPTMDGEVSFNDIGASATADTLTCTDTLAALSGTALGQDVFYEWFVQDTLIATSPDTSVSQAGEYTLIATSGNCTDTARVTVVYDTLPPASPLVEPDTLTCLSPTVTLQADSMVTAYNYSWENTAGVFLGMESISVDTGGSYVLRVVDLLNGCSSLDTVDVVEFTSLPMIDIEGDSMINCNNNSVDLNAIVSQVEGTPLLEWADAEGDVLSNNAVLNVSGEGEYQLTVVDSLTGCAAQSLVNVTLDTLPPSVNIDGIETLSCVVDTVNLLAEVGVMDAASAVYTWTASDGTVVSDSAHLSVTDTALYTISVLDTISGCSSMEMVQLEGNFTQPTGQAGAVGNIDCFIPSSILVVSGNSPFEVREWRDSTGTVLASTQVTTPGLYFVTLTNTMSGCSRVDSVRVEVDTLSPQVMLLPSADSVISCANNSVRLEIADSSVYSIQWLNSFGALLSTSSAATVSGFGDFTLQVTNTSNGCTTDTIFTVAADTVSPTLMVNALNAEINCVDSSFIFSASSPNPMVTLQWQNLSGDTLSQADTLVASLLGDYQVIGLDTVNGCTSTVNVNLSSNQTLPDVDVSGDTLLTCSASTVAIEAAVTNSTDIVYQWADENGVALSDSSTLVVSQEGLYTLSAVDTVSGCVSTVQQTVGSSLDPPLASIENGAFDTITCAQPNVNLQGASVAPAMKYCWLDSIGNVLADNTLLQVTAGGVYSFQVEDPATGCDTTLHIEVLVDTLAPDFSLSVSDTLDCENTTAELRIEAVGSDASCAWVGIADSCSVEVSAAGFYTAEVTDNSNGCEASATAEVLQLDSLPLFSLTASGELSCTNESVVLSIDNALQDVVYTWATASVDSTIATSASATVMAAGWYTLSLIDTTTTCSATDSIFVLADTSLPDATVAASGIITCLDSLVNLTATNLSSNTTVEWLSPTGDTLQNPQADEPGLYTAILRDTTNGCAIQEQVVVQEDITLPVIEVQLSSDSVITCDNSSVVFDATIGADETATWTAGASGQVVTSVPDAVLLEPGAYQFTVQNMSSGCQADTLIQVQADTLSPDLNLSSTAITLGCTDSVTVITASSAASNISYSWQNESLEVVSDSSALATALQGTYTVTATNEANGCQSTAAAVVTVDDQLPMPEIAGEQVLSCDVDSLELSVDMPEPNVVYEWSDGIQVLANGSSLVVSAPGQYELLAIDTSNNCQVVVPWGVNPATAAPAVGILQGTSGTLTCEQTEFQLDVTGDTSANVAFIWENAQGDTLSVGSALSLDEEAGAGIYTLLATDVQTGCDTLVEFELVADTLAPDIEIQGSEPLDCSGEAVALTIFSNTPGITCEWMGQSAGCSLSVTAPGTYEAEVTDPSNGCTAVDSVLITQVDSVEQVEIFQSGNLNCAVSDVTLAADSTNPSVVYFWLNSDNDTLVFQPTLNVETPGVYTLLLLDTTTACSAMQEAEVLQNENQPSAELAASSVLTCRTDTVFLVSTDLGPNTVVNWFDETGVPLEGNAVTTGGTYSAMLLDTISQCEISDVVQVIADTISPSLAVNYVSDSLLTCAVTSVTLQAASQEQVSYNWVDVNGNTIGNQNEVELATAGTYLVTVEDAENGCTATDAISIGLDTLAPVASISWDGVFDCVENSALLSAVEAPNYSYQWSGPANAVGTATAFSTQVSATGVYELEVTDNSNGCTAVSSLEVSSLAEQIDYLDFEVLSSGCDAENTNGVLRIQGAVGTDADLWYAIDNADFSAATVYDGLVPDQYALFAEDAYGCQYDTVFTVEVGNGHTVSILPSDTTIFLGDSLRLTSFFDVPTDQIDSILWEDRGQNSDCLSCPQIMVQPLFTTTYSVTSIDANGCVSTATATVFVDRTPQLYIPNVFSPNDDGVNDIFEVFPKPGSGLLVTKVAIYNRWGGLVYDRALQGWDGTSKGDDLPSGVYVCQIGFRDASGRTHSVSQELLLLR